MMPPGPTRRALLALPGLLGACSVLPQRAYEERRQWPLLAPRPTALPPRPGGKVLLVRTLGAGPGLEARGLRTLQPDGSVRAAAYEEWSVPPAEAVEDATRRWLADSGLFAAVLAPGSRLPADLVLEGELDALVAEAAPDARTGRLRAAIGFVLLRQQALVTRALLQRTATAQRPLPDLQPATIAHAGGAALADLLAQIEASLAPFA